MRRVIYGLLMLGIVVTLGLFVYVAMGQEPPPVVDSPSNDIMVVFYNNTDDSVIGWARYGPDLEITDYEGTLTVTSDDLVLRGADSTVIDYAFYKYKDLETYYDPLDGYGTRAALSLEAVEAADLPASEHIAKVKAIDPTKAKPVTVTRKWAGQTYDIDCLISQGVRDLYQAGDIGVGDFVIVSFIEEHPNETEIHVPIVTDKVFKSWN